jgi:hypothetical protein
VYKGKKRRKLIMAIYRIHKEDNYVIVDKAFLLNEKISLKAKGLLALLLSYPDNWQFYEAEIVQHAADKANSLSSGLKELIENGYIVRKLGKDETGKFKGYEYHIYEKPITEKPITEKPIMEKPITEKPITEKPITEKPITENSVLLNNKDTKNKDTKNKNTKNKNTKTASSPELASEFKEWYSKYPHPRNEQQTMKNYIKARKTYSAEQLMTALNNYLAEIEEQHTDKRYIKHSTNFVGQEQAFVDYLDTPAQPVLTEETDDSYIATIEAEDPEYAARLRRRDNDV